MDYLNKEIEKYYFREGLLEDILHRMEMQGTDLSAVSRTDFSRIDEFHVGGAAVSKELANSIPLKGMKVLDVGCGLGGPCRMLADEFDCDTTGLDLSSEYIRTAKGLSELVELDHKTNFVQGDATVLPFDDNSFDVLWTQHVQMNVSDKRKFYSEINRVLNSGGHFIYYDVFRKRKGKISYPMPWAGDSRHSFLIRHQEMHGITSDLGLTRMQFIDQSQKGIDFFEVLVEKLRVFGLPKFGLNILMGETTQSKLMNLLKHLKSGELELQSGIYQK